MMKNIAKKLLSKISFLIMLSMMLGIVLPSFYVPAHAISHIDHEEITNNTLNSSTSTVSTSSSNNVIEINKAGGTNYSIFNSGRSGSATYYKSTTNYNENSYNNGGYDLYAYMGQSNEVIQLGLPFVISTNIAETSVTISDISTVIDSGLAKLNFYSPRTFTSSLIETSVSKASCNQRKGRAGRTREGTCYRLYPRNNFEMRPLYTTEEIYRTDLSEVVLRMSELGITDFYNFDFISPPGHEGIIGAVDTLNMLGALDSDNTLSSIGQMMVKFPLEPRISRIIVESIMRFPEVLDKVLIASSFLSANSPFVLPQGEEIEARKAHHRFRDIQGDFVSYLHLYEAYCQSPFKEKFCKKNYLDERVMAEIDNINFQLHEIVSRMNIPISTGGNIQDYLCCIAAGMIQFVCIRVGREKYRSLTANNICIHPGSVMFKQDPLFIVAAEIIKTTRIYASSVSPLTKKIVDIIKSTDIFVDYVFDDSAEQQTTTESDENKTEEAATPLTEKEVRELFLKAHNLYVDWSSPVTKYLDTDWDKVTVIDGEEYFEVVPNKITSVDELKKEYGNYFSEEIIK